MSNKPSAKSSLKPSPMSAAKSASKPPPRDGFEYGEELKKKMFVDDHLYLFLLTQIGYRAAELRICPYLMKLRGTSGGLGPDARQKSPTS